MTPGPAPAPRPMPQTIRALVEGFEPARRDTVAFEAPAADGWQQLTFGALQERVRGIGQALFDWGLRPGDRVGLLAENRLEWPLAFLALTAAGLNVVALDIFMTPAELARVLRLAAPRLVFTSARYLDAVEAARARGAAIEHVVSFDAPGAPDPEDAPLAWARLARAGRGRPAAGSDRYAAATVTPDAVATTIFLSSTLGVDLTHRAILSNLEGFYPLMGPECVGKRWLSLLPFHHAWPTVIGLLYPLWTGCTNTVLATTKLDALFATLAERRSHYVMMVPALVDRVYEAIHGHARAAGLFAGLDLPAGTPPVAQFQAALAEPSRRRVLDATLARLGLAGLEGIFCAGAHLFVGAAARMKALGLDVLDNYGLTEMAPTISHSTPRHHRLGAAGRVIPTVEVRIDRPDRHGNGEILARGPGLMRGYFQDPAATRAVIDADGWLHTGDVGVLDADGFLYITGRCKPIVVTSGGKNVYPPEVEAAIRQSPFVAEVVVTPRIVNDREAPYAVVRPALEALAQFEREQGRRLSDAELRDLIARELARVTADVAHYKVPEDFELTWASLDVAAFRARVVRFEQPPEVAAAPGQAGLPDRAAPPSAPAGEPDPALLGRVAGYLVDRIEAVRPATGGPVDPELSFLTYLSSLDIVEISRRIEHEVGIKLYPHMLFQHIDIASLARYFTTEFAGPFAAYLAAHPVAERPAAGPGRPLPRPAAAPPPAGKRALPRRSDRQQDPVAIVGLAGRFPGSPDAAAFFDHLVAGHDLVTEIPPQRFDWRAYDGDPLAEPNRMNTRFGGFIDDIDCFDAAFFGISPREARLMDPQQRLMLETVYHALEDAGQAPGALAGGSVGIFAGVTAYDYADILRRHTTEVGVYAYSSTSPAILPNRISYLLGLHGPSEVVDTACSSALVAIHRARLAILAGECDMAVAGGVNALLTPDLFISFCMAGMLSPDGRCKTFSRQANGYVRGEGVGAVVLKPLSAALAAGDDVRAVIRGSAVNHGGRAMSFTAPNPNAQAALIVAACLDGDVDPDSLSYIEAHGTGTNLGDPVEVNGLKQAFARLHAARGRSAIRPGSCGLGSVKSNIGHLESAAGIAGVVKVLLAMQHGWLPPSLHVDEINPYLELDGSPFYIVREGRPWARPAGPDGAPWPRRAGVSSFGVGGTNAHVVLEQLEPPVRPEEPGEQPPQLVVLSARSAERLAAQADGLARGLARFVPGAAGGGGAGPAPRLCDVAFTLQTGRDAMPERLALVVSSLPELVARLTAFAAGRIAEARVVRGSSDDPAAAAEAAAAVAAADPAGLARAWVAGGEVDWARLHAGRPPGRVSLPGYPFVRRRHWVG